MKSGTTALGPRECAILDWRCLLHLVPSPVRLFDPVLLLLSFPFPFHSPFLNSVSQPGWPFVATASLSWISFLANYSKILASLLHAVALAAYSSFSFGKCSVYCLAW